MSRSTPVIRPPRAAPRGGLVGACPVAHQAWPRDLLPPALRDDNPWGVPQRIDGRLSA
ncbi:hypothetical protein [Streptomyces xanthii]|uniref:Uncharacterized protein n=1 Tax=Streptomyces xanthii TaxID=2768069 RepID=A0A7H1B427_9ACTN|nr:hypothetical protein [Streptomyces xanthii]QNS03482.1 hypothetical protein IAG42_07435 [Streptomyces xanthii]